MFIYETALIIGVSLVLMIIFLFQFQEKIEELAEVSLSSLFTWHNLWAPLSVVTFLFVIGGILPGKVFSFDSRYSGLPSPILKRIGDGKGYCCLLNLQGWLLCLD